MSEEPKSNGAQLLPEWANIAVIFRREFKNYFNTPIGYIFLGIFVLVVNFFLFNMFNFWDRGRNPGSFFEIIRGAYILFVPAVTMRLWAEEKKTGTIEMLLTLPITTMELILGKFLSAIAFLGVGLLGTIMLPITVAFGGTADWFVIIGGYIGVLLLGGAYIAVGLFISWLTRDQIVAFLITVIVCLVIWFMGYHLVLQYVGPFRDIFAFLSISWHFDSLARGLLDTRDLLYFATVIGLFLYLNKRSIDNWRGVHIELSQP